MDGWTTLRYIYFAGLVFNALWIIGTNLKEGLWGNVLLFFNWCIACAGAFAVWLPTLKLTLNALRPKPDDQLLIVAVAMGLFWILFLALFAGMRSATDGLSRVKVAFHPVIDTIGSLAFCGLLFAGIGVASLPVLVVLALGKPG